ncbi:hypothetical protein FPOAC2_08822 [Fusarium poae]|jgi:hypothetical protein|uniref:Uncharacterized protein n=1 Tax=Fusarium poae TaxID=36050 RepID=A0A1B8AN08_FUSPO|nr:hypothetical protein FPOA_08052 [Fusarium poae]
MAPSRLIIRPVARMPFRLCQQRLASTKPNPKHVYSDGNLGGPGGQQPPPQAPGGPEALKRNWPPIAAAAAVLAGGFWIMLPRKGNPPEMTLQSYKDLKNLDSPEGLKELSGRKPNPLGGFRAD